MGKIEAVSLAILLTGLKDKNNKEIYEEDILSFQKTLTKYKRGDADLMIVKYYPEFARFGLEFQSIYGGEGYTGDQENMHRYILDGAQVIGNIHENPELVKGV